MVFHYIFLGKKAIIITFKHDTRILFPITILFLENSKKNVPKSAWKYKRKNVLMPPGHPIILLKSNEFNMAAVSVKKVYSFIVLFFIQNISLFLFNNFSLSKTLFKPFAYFPAQFFLAALPIQRFICFAYSYNSSVQF